MITVAELAARIEQPTALRVLHHLPMMLTTTTWQRLDQRALAHLLRRSQPTVSHAMQALISAGAVARTGKGPGVRYRLSPSVAWDGGIIDGAAHNGPYAPTGGSVTGAEQPLVVPPPPQPQRFQPIWPRRAQRWSARALRWTSPSGRPRPRRLHAPAAPSARPRVTR